MHLSPTVAAVAIVSSTIVASGVAYATQVPDTVAVFSDFSHPVSTTFNDKVWPLLMDVGTPLAKTMMAVGMYRMMRNDVNGGWPTVYRAGLGLLGLYLIDSVVKIIVAVGSSMQG